MLIPINYLAEGRVRHKNFGYEGYRIDLVGIGPGSLQALLQIQLTAEELSVLKEVGIALSSTFIYDFLKGIYNRTIGKTAPDEIEQLESSGILNTGDLSALEDAVLPSVKRAHTVINKGANNIFIFADRGSVVNFNSVTKSYVLSSVSNTDLRAKIVSVPSYNANSRYGRVFDFDFGKTVPFTLSPEADDTTITTITGSITDYALAKRSDKLASAVAIQYTSVDSDDGKIKKLTIFKARKEITDLWVE